MNDDWDHFYFANASADLVDLNQNTFQKDITADDYTILDLDANEKENRILDLDANEKENRILDLDANEKENRILDLDANEKENRILDLDANEKENRILDLDANEKENRILDLDANEKENRILDLDANEKGNRICKGSSDIQYDDSALKTMINEHLQEDSKMDNEQEVNILDSQSINDDQSHKSRPAIEGRQTVHSCSDCHDVFETFGALKAHRHGKIREEFTCDECCEVFPFMAYLQVHKSSNHGTVGASVVWKNNRYLYSCDACGSLEPTLDKLQIHNLIHTNEGLFQCCFCPQKFVQRIELKHHIKVHKETGIIKCRKCNMWCENAAALGRHKLECKEIKCYICNIDFPNRTSRNQHYKDCHPNDILRCHLCIHLFSSQEELNDHVEKHSLIKKKQCPKCGLFFTKLKNHLLSHRKRAEFNANELYFCDKCPANFTNQAAFSRHCKSHLKEKPYQCPQCSSSFADCGSLYHHIQCHAVHATHVCGVCNDAFTTKKKLRRHISKHYNAQKNHSFTPIIPVAAETLPMDDQALATV